MTYGMEKDIVPKLLARSAEVQASLKNTLNRREPIVPQQATDAAGLLEQMSDWLDRVGQRNDLLVAEMRRAWEKR